MIKKLLGGIGGTGLVVSYFYNKHMYDKELFDRINYLLQNNIKTSGVYLQQRQPFGFLWYVQWLLPYHQSLKILQPDGKFRHVGLGGSKERKGFFDMTSEFVLHKGGNYETLGHFESSIPIECWVDYKRKFGHFPENINVDTLNKLTVTREEATDNTQIYTVTYGKFSKDLNGDPIVVSCRSVIVDVVRKEELSRTE